MKINITLMYYSFVPNKIKNSELNEYIYYILIKVIVG